MQKIIVLNPKGGSGKTTLAINLASYFAVQGLRPTLMDMDPQGSSMRWLKKRQADQPAIHAIAGYDRNPRVTKTFAMRIPQGCERVIVDTAAGIEAQRLADTTRNSTAILVPVLPSDIDIAAATRCISNLLLVAKIPRSEQRIGVVANRVKRNTLMYKSLMKFLETLRIPIVAILRDSQTYIRGAENGQGIFEMKPNTVHDDLATWNPLIEWLAQKGETTHTGPVIPASTEPVRRIVIEEESV